MDSGDVVEWRRGADHGGRGDMEIHLREVLANTRCMTDIIAHHSGRSFVEVECDIDRDYFMTAREALDYGLIDRVLTLCAGSRPQFRRRGRNGSPAVLRAAKAAVCRRRPWPPSVRRHRPARRRPGARAPAASPWCQ